MDCLVWSKIEGDRGKNLCRAEKTAPDFISDRIPEVLSSLLRAET